MTTDHFKTIRDALVSSNLCSGSCRGSEDALTALVVIEKSCLSPVPQDVINLVIAARIVAFEDQSQEAIKELATASEAFADRIPWEDEPDPCSSVFGDDEMTPQSEPSTSEDEVIKLADDFRDSMFADAPYQIKWTADTLVIVRSLLAQHATGRDMALEEAAHLLDGKLHELDSETRSYAEWFAKQIRALKQPAA